MPVKASRTKTTPKQKVRKVWKRATLCRDSFGYYVLLNGQPIYSVHASTPADAWGAAARALK